MRDPLHFYEHISRNREATCAVQVAPSTAPCWGDSYPKWQMSRQRHGRTPRRARLKTDLPEHPAYRDFSIAVRSFRSLLLHAEHTSLAENATVLRVFASTATGCTL